MNENPEIEQNHRSTTAENFYKVGHDGIRLR